MGPSTGELVESKHDSEKITENKYAAHLFNVISANKVNVKIRCVQFTLSQDMHLQEAFTGMQMSRVGAGTFFPSGLEHLPIPGHCLCLLISSQMKAQTFTRAT